MIQSYGEAKGAVDITRFIMTSTYEIEIIRTSWVQKISEPLSLSSPCLQGRFSTRSLSVQSVLLLNRDSRIVLCEKILRAVLEKTISSEFNMY